MSDSLQSFSLLSTLRRVPTQMSISLSLLDFVACLWERSRLLKHHHRRRHSRIESVNARTERSARVLSSFCNYDFSRAKRDTNRERGRERERALFPGDIGLVNRDVCLSARCRSNRSIRGFDSIVCIDLSLSL